MFSAQYYVVLYIECLDYIIIVTMCARILCCADDCNTRKPINCYYFSYINLLAAL